MTSESAYLEKEEDSGLVTIPVHPISFGDAQMLLQYVSILVYWYSSLIIEQIIIWVFRLDKCFKVRMNYTAVCIY